MQSSDFNAPRYWSEGCFFLAERDPILAAVMEQFPESRLCSRGCAFTTLLRSIIGQQISVKAADAVWARFLAVCGDMLNPKSVLNATVEALRGAGLSGQKIKYVSDIAVHFRDRPENLLPFQDLSAKEIYDELIPVKGIGPWTIDMFLIFHALQPDVLPLGDLGLVKAMRQFYPSLAEASKQELEDFAQLWRPYRSIATWYLWRALDPVDVEY